MPENYLDPDENPVAPLAFSDDEDIGEQLIGADVLHDLADRCRAKAGEYLSTARAYNCHSTRDAKAGLIKGAAVLNMVAGWIESEAERS